MCLLEKKNELDSFLFVQIDEYILGLDDILYVTLNDCWLNFYVLVRTLGNRIVHILFIQVEIT